MPISKIVELKNARKKVDYWNAKVEMLVVEKYHILRRNRKIRMMHKRGLSLRKIANELQNVYSYNMSHSGIDNIIKENV